MVQTHNTDRSNGSLTNDSNPNLAGSIPVDIHQVSIALKNLLDAISNEDTSPATTLECWNKIYKILDGVKKFFQGVEIMVSFPVYEDLLQRLRLGIAHPIKEIRSICYRTLRTLICETTLHFVAQNHFDLLIIRSLVRDARYDSEKEQTMRFVRAFLDHELGPSLLPISIVRVLVAIGEQVDDKFRHIAIETISELAIRKPEYAAYTGVFKAIFGYVFDGPKEMVEPLISTVLFLLDAHETRKYLRPQIELEMAISHFVDAYTSKGAFSPEKLQTSANVIKSILSTWTGLICFCMEDFRAIRAIVETMGLPHDETRMAMLKMFFDLFRITLPSSNDTSSLSKQFKVANKRTPFNLVNQYYAVLVMIFVDAGLMEVLVDMSQSTNRQISDLSIHLLSHLLARCSTQLPETYTMRVQSLSTLFKTAADFQDEERRHHAMAKLGSILDKHMGNQSNPKKDILTLEDLNLTLVEQNILPATTSSPDFVINASIKSLIGSRMEENHFKTLLAETEVLGVKDFTKWNWDLICELVESQMMIKSRFDDLTKNTKFVSRLLTFFKPLSHQFADSAKNGAPPKIVKLGCDLVKLLASSPEGQRVLIESRLFADIEEALAQLVDPVMGALNSDMIFTRERLELTLSSEYFKFIGAMTSIPEGLRLLEQMRIYTLLYQIMELRGRDDVFKNIITSLSYKHDGHPRIILGKALTVGYKQNRLFATSFLEQLYDLKCPDFSVWAIPLLVQQLYDPHYEIYEKAAHVLHKICKDEEGTECVEAIIQARPLVSHLSEVANFLLLDLLAVSSGFEYLKEEGYIETELEYWFEHGIIQYVTQVELSIVEGLTPPQLPKGNKKEVLNVHPISLNLFGTLPPHFYGKLAKTSLGCDLLARTNHVQAFVDILKNYRKTEMSEKGIFKLKAIIWALANIGSSLTGLALLNQFDVLALLIEVSKLSLTLSLRGTTFFGICLIGQSITGREALQDHGWGFEGTLCLPKNIKEYVDIPPWQFDGSWPLHQRLGFKPVHYKLDPIEDEILKCLGNLSNHILATAASKRLAVIRQQQPFLFSRPELCLQAWRIATVYHYRIPTRRFIQELFDKVVFDEEALDILDLMDGLVMDYAVDEKEMAKLNENTLKSSLALLPKDPEKSSSDKKANAKNRMSLNPVKVIKGF